MFFFTADGILDSGQGSSVYSESRLGSQQTVSYGSQQDPILPSGTISGYSTPAQPGVGVRKQTEFLIDIILSIMALLLVMKSLSAAETQKKNSSLEQHFLKESKVLCLCSKWNPLNARCIPEI